MLGLRPARASILVVEDDPAMARMLVDALELADYRVWHAADGQEARAHLERARPDLILLDLLLPDIDGLVLCSLLKSLAEVPIVICSASSRRSDPILSLKLGADDFVRKPFELDDLLARIEAVLRRAPPKTLGAPLPPPATAGTPCTSTASARAAGAIARGACEADQRALAARPGSVLTRDRLAQEVWGYADASNGRTIDVHIRRLRVKLSQARLRGPTIVSVRGLGYRISTEVSAFSAA